MIGGCSSGSWSTVKRKTHVQQPFRCFCHDSEVPWHLHPHQQLPLDVERCCSGPCPANWPKALCLFRLLTYHWQQFCACMFTSAKRHVCRKLEGKWGYRDMTGQCFFGGGRMAFLLPLSSQQADSSGHPLDPILSRSCWHKREKGSGFPSN